MTTIEDMYYCDLSGEFAREYKEDDKKIDQCAHVFSALIARLENTIENKNICNQLRESICDLNRAECCKAYKMGIAKGQELANLLNEVSA